MKPYVPLVAAVIFAATTQPSLADRIDGDWCAPGGGSISVDGPNVVTPGGRKIIANYNRHHVDFEIPKGEPDAGGRFSADQLNDEEISVSIVAAGDAGAGKAVIWRPCKPIS